MTVYNNNNSVLNFEKQEKAAWPSGQRAELVQSGPRVPLCRALLSKVPESCFMFPGFAFNIKASIILKTVK